MTPDPAERLRAAAPAAFEGESVTFAYLFGSRAIGQARPGSDVDVAVLLDESVPPEEHLGASLRLARRLADCSGVAGIEAVVVLNAAPLPLAGRIRRQRLVLYSRDEPARVAYESYIARRYNDFRIHEAPRDRERLRAIAEGRR
ncbi:MAG TPA: nucleotidyltransferase domain-containing protein [Egibacteraceae bacterium]|nr:nucleotidyltransferase domain-containing protein [Egibacteraceae bacterium]